MALKKNNIENKKLKELDFNEAKNIFISQDSSEDEKIEALENMIKNDNFKEVFEIFLELSINSNDLKWHIYIDLLFSQFDNHLKENSHILTKMLKGQNVYLRNMVIKYLRENGEYTISYLKDLMKNDDKDIRIFAINIIGDVKFEESVQMLRYFIAHESDINAMMTAIDYLGEVGSFSDLELLEAVKKEHSNNPYVVFGVDTAIQRVKGI